MPDSDGDETENEVEDEVEEVDAEGLTGDSEENEQGEWEDEY